MSLTIPIHSHPCRDYEREDSFFSEPRGGSTMPCMGRLDCRHWMKSSGVLAVFAVRMGWRPFSKPSRPVFRARVSVFSKPRDVAATLQFIRPLQGGFPTSSRCATLRPHSGEPPGIFASDGPITYAATTGAALTNRIELWRRPKRRKAATAKI